MRKREHLMGDEKFPIIKIPRSVGRKLNKRKKYEI
jgi:hypothetical protein